MRIHFQARVSSKVDQESEPRDGPAETPPTTWNINVNISERGKDKTNTQGLTALNELLAKKIKIYHQTSALIITLEKHATQCQKKIKINPRATTTVTDPSCYYIVCDS